MRTAKILVLGVTLNSCAAMASAFTAMLPFVRKGLDIIEHVLPATGTQAVPIAAARAACRAARDQVDAAAATKDEADDEPAVLAAEAAQDALKRAVLEATNVDVDAGTGVGGGAP